MPKTIPKPITAFVNECVFGAKSGRPYRTRSVSLENGYYSQVTGEYAVGSGICLKVESEPLSKQHTRKTAIQFIVSDGDYAIPCIAHNGTSAVLPSPKTPSELASCLRVVSDSIKNGTQVFVSGAFCTHKGKRVFVVDSIEATTRNLESQLTDVQFRQFIDLCDKHKTDPLRLMMRDDTLWAELFAKDYLKMAILLFCLSPMRKQDMLHIGIVSSVGEGKDHLIERVVEPLLPVGVASTGKLCTIPGLFGAMSGDDINSIELGLIPKMNNERIAVSEFQTWGGDVFGELMNTMANGYFTMQKGQVQTRRDANVNMLFLGNPPKEYEDGTHDKSVMLAAFGEYTPQIISRLSLIFTQMSLAGDDAKDKIRDAIVKTMDNHHTRSGNIHNLDMWRTFFREYLRKVSVMEPELGAFVQTINSEYDKMEGMGQFVAAFLLKGRVNNDYRKYQEFANLCRGFARLRGHSQVKVGDILTAKTLFQKSLSTLTDDFPTEALVRGVVNEEVQAHRDLCAIAPTFDTISEAKSKGINITHKILDSLVKYGAVRQFSDKTYHTVDDFNWDNMGVKDNE